MKGQVVPSLIVATVVIVGGIIYFNYDIKRKEEIFEKWNKEYPNISFDEKVDGTITNVKYQLDPKIFRNDPHSAWIILNDSIKRRVKSSDELTKDITLDNVLTTGDHLVKKSKDDKFIIFKIVNGDTLKYEFELRDELGYPIKSKAVK